MISSGKHSLRRQLQFVAAIAAIVLPLYSAAAEEAVQFNKDIRPIFAEHCAACHGGVKQAGGLSFVYQDNVFAGGESGQPSVVPGDVEASYLIDRVTDADPDSRMPPAEHGPPLSAAEIERLKKWIAAGAKWETPWAFVPPKEVAPPEVEKAAWPTSDLDRFVLAKLEAAGLEPAPPASRREWLRRVSFDLIGLPPTVAELEEFEIDDHPDAYGRVVDRLLASPQFGERWASLWLDLARYADTTGYERDPHRNIWPYRDWVIRAFNADMPYDEFTIKQLAGDLLDAPSFDDVLATAFHRNTQTNTEGGTDDEEFRIAAVIDRVNTTWQVWQATTFGCVQCHSHPYDPFRHDEYYKFMALFNSSRDSDIDEEYPTQRVPVDGKEHDKAAAIQREQSQLRRKLDAETRPLAENAASWRNLPIDKANSTGSTQLRIARDDAAGGPGDTDVFAEGTVTAQSKFTLESPIPSDVDRITALRIDALLRDPEAARKIPQLGFILSQLEVELLPPNDAPVKLKFSHAQSDEVEPLVDPAGSLDKDEWGWSCYSCQWRPHYGVFALASPVMVPPGSRLRITLHQNRSTVGDGALVIYRGRFAITASDAWPRLQATPEFVASKNRLRELREQLDEIDTVSVPVMGELAGDERRATFEFIRGLWLDKGAEVEPNTPELLPPLPQGVAHDRLAMARWLVSDSNPLTARVMVNRIWEQLFGIGIVETAEDFGTSGTPPSHPELLDHLALRFEHEQKWSIKKLLRDIVLSATYRQSARVTAEKLAADPQNRLLSRGPRQRLTAEMIRDQALVLSGRFSPKMFGPPVMPPQPDGIWRSVYSSEKWENATDENRYRRAIYTYWKRTSGYPSMATFDAPSREVCTARRITTNTPLQALVTLNDQAFVECAAGFADRMLTEGGQTPAERIAWAYHTATGSDPSNDTRADLVTLYEAALESFTADPAAAKKIAATPERAALSVVASAILNLDEVQTR